MRVPRFWETETADASSPDGRQFKASCWGWSEHSPDEARSRAAESARRLVNRLLNSGPLPNHYGYDERLPREEIIDEFTDDQGTQAFVTRNAYGSLILNTRDLMFIDVDFPHQPAGIPMPGFLRKMLGKEPPPDQQQVVGNRIRETAQRYRDLGFRIYRTSNGFRVMVPSRPIHADSPEALRMLDEFGADPLYQRMCKNQDCFRARLTPKAWRCNVPAPPCRYPFSNHAQETLYRQWERKYLGATSSFSTCRFVETIGDENADPALQGLIELHDKLSKCHQGDPLA